MIRNWGRWMMLLGLAVPGVLHSAETVRVEVAQGAPRLLVDGQAVRPRMFFGLPGTRPLQFDSSGQAFTFEFIAHRDAAGSATVHFRFGPQAGVVELDDIQIQDVTTGREVVPLQDFEGGPETFSDNWTMYPRDERNTVGRVEVAAGAGRDGSAGMRIALQNPPAGRWPDFHVYHHPNLTLENGHRYRMTLWGRAEPARAVEVAFYLPGDPYVFLGGPSNGYESQIAMADASGARFISFPVDLPWPRPGEPVDWSVSEAQCQQVLDACPGALLLPRISVNAPTWWRRAHPDDDMVWDSGPRFGFAVVASPRYRQEAAERLAALVSHLEAQFGPHMAGYHPCGQNTDEWFYAETWGPALNGYAPGDTAAWRTWLQARYRDDDALRAAWGRPAAALRTAEVPSPAERRAAPAGALRDPVQERAVIDFTLFQQEAMADCVCQLAQAVRQATHGRKLVVFFFGYVFEFGAIANGPGTAGHYALRRVLDCPDIDVLCSPISYFDRGLGQGGLAMTAAESVALAGKMWLYEDDTRTYLSAPDSGYDRVDTLAKTQAVLLRNTSQCAVRNFATWWMDLGAAGWYDDPQLWSVMETLSALDEPLLADPQAYRPEVAAVIDETSMMRVTPRGSAVTLPGVYQARRPLSRMGSPFGQYLQDDVLRGRVAAKLYVFLTAWCLSPEQRQQLRAATANSLRVWCYAPGYQEPDGTSPAAMRELTGFHLAPVTLPMALAEPTEVGRRDGLNEAVGPTVPIEPLFAATDATADETLATYSDGSAAIALRRLPDGWSLFVGPPGLSSELLRVAARRADVHLYTDRDCNVYGNGKYLIVHAAEDGPLTIDTGAACALRDLFDHTELGHGPRVTLPIQMGETRVLVLDPR